MKTATFIKSGKNTFESQNRRDRLSIIGVAQPTEEVLKDIREVEAICNEHDKLKGSLFLDHSLNYHQEMKNLFLYYEENRLVSLLCMFIPTSQEAEVSAYTLPEYRRLGYFKRLLTEAEEELKKYKIPDLVFVCEAQSSDGKEAIRKIKAEYAFTEYYLKFKEFPFEVAKKQPSRVNLQKAEEKDMERIINLSQEIFGDDYEDAKSMVTKTFEADNRLQYIASVDNQPIGMVSVSFDHGEASIFGFGVLPEYQGKGLGGEIIQSLILELLKNQTESISLEVDSSNQNAFHLYLKYGFEIETAYEYFRKML
jgi:ribosomal protein S18 acetylase RimI-like enzyme